MERAAGIEPASSAWKAEVIAIIRCPRKMHLIAKNNASALLVTKLTVASERKYGGGGRIRTIEAFAADLQSAPFGHSGTPPRLKWCRLPESNW